MIVVIILTAGVTAYFTYQLNAQRYLKFRAWMNDPAAYPDWTLAAGSICGSSPFLFPTDGFAGFLWGDSMGRLHLHQGIDIFGGTDVGITRVVSAYPGYLTRLPKWKSAVIVRVPSDPLNPSQQIWLYYTHMADAAGNSFIAADFPPGTSEVFVQAETLLGHQGDYSGDPNNPVGIHLHFSIVRDDGHGSFTNELEIRNTYDPSPYLGLELNAKSNQGEVPLCATPVE